LPVRRNRNQANFATPYCSRRSDQDSQRKKFSGRAGLSHYGKFGELWGMSRRIAMSNENCIPWEGQCLDAAATFAQRCAELYSSNPYAEKPLLGVINTLMTELWDRGFSQSEIRSAFEEAVSDMPRYAAGEERRGNSDTC
jgi:hypothetical protein